ncbi:MAG: energy-coupling factor ABC transporter ATP-binding protein [Corynebacterium sp.]|uniref:energy-coupling factor ABC transporter ATP-binding protein n=1 Tax=unclassified Corynebacterium TaxID=2624378 RepID=UPI00264A1FE0|nr:ABC transporter ATP-binding protein [Corynebacterium sp.]MDN5581710.1 energy-coupling factor ABC transporter ATP-binding protein [Corynebacterium sp.]MDN5720404.1 energy-coupling factor ABC transporter ATP-binding protein [Corynebacterium sp.]MDN6325925.1 energy-coupling factor ABC transporter ATP-binding protein [Corynebacterium sp.]MDN6509958.1 energy-coupling factor ABC transporter ATP-binding protein [Corynebacterium sp.]
MTVTYDRAGVVVDGSTLLHPVTLDLTEQRVSVIGANGSGKSTLIRMINGLTPATSGTVEVDGVPVGRRGRKVRGAVGFLFSDPDNQIIMPSVAEDVAFSLRGSGLSRTQIAERVAESLRAVGLEGKDEQSPHLLSGGEKQMLALASITALSPQVVVADEPSCLLDLVNRNRLRRTLDSLEQQVITVTHDLELAADAERTICVDDGRIVDDGAPDDVIAAYVRRMSEVGCR